MDWWIVNLLLLACVGPLLAAMSAKQSSTWNDLDTSLTLDLNSSTCALTGYLRYAWYVLDMGEELTVNKVFISGKGLKNVYLTVGDNDISDGSFNGFKGNHDCSIIKTEIPDNQDYGIDCFLPVTGRYITLEMLSERDIPHRLEICEFSFLSI